MFGRDDLVPLSSLNQEYNIIVCNGHDIRIRCRITGHEWIIVSPYDGGPCEILHRHSARDPFHRQQGRYSSLSSALEYIQGHDKWYRRKQTGEVDAEI